MVMEDDVEDGLIATQLACFIVPLAPHHVQLAVTTLIGLGLDHRHHHRHICKTPTPPPLQGSILSVTGQSAQHSSRFPKRIKLPEY
jgi:hypothetical protein